MDALSPAQQTAELFDKFNNAPITEWNYLDKVAINDQFDNKSEPSLRAWVRDGLSGTTSFILKTEFTSTQIDPDMLFEKLSDTRWRMENDPRWCEPEMIEERQDGSKVIFMCTPKPKIPIISKRQILLESFTLMNHGGEGRHLEVGRSIEHPSKPAASGMFADVRANITVIGILVEKNPKGEGSRMTEIRAIDLCGSLPGAAVKKAT